MAAFTLTQYKTFMSDAVAMAVIDEVASGKAGSNQLLSMLPFTSNAQLTRVANKLAWVYTYYRREVQRGLAVRQVNNDYTPEQVAAPADYSVELSIYGGSFEFDRVVRDAGDVVDFYDEQFGALQTGVAPKYWDLAINGTVATPGEFDGLDVALAGGPTEYNATAHIDLSTQTLIENNWKDFRFEFSKFNKLLKRKPDAYLINGVFDPIFAEMARYSGQYMLTQDEFGRSVHMWEGVPFIDVGEKDGSTDPIIPVETRDYGSGNVTGLTDLYAVCFGEQELHGIAPSDKEAMVQTYIPDLKQPGVLKKGELEVVASIALEHSKAAAVFRNIKVA